MNGLRDVTGILIGPGAGGKTPRVRRVGYGARTIPVRRYERARTGPTGSAAGDGPAIPFTDDSIMLQAGRPATPPPCRAAAGGGALTRHSTVMRASRSPAVAASGPGRASRSSRSARRVSSACRTSAMACIASGQRGGGGLVLADDGRRGGGRRLDGVRGHGLIRGVLLGHGLDSGFAPSLARMG